jgi:hypothetical protein
MQSSERTAMLGPSTLVPRGRVYWAYALKSYLGGAI